MPDYEWRFEPCESDRAAEGKAYKHAARAVRPIAGGRQVEYGYGETESGAIDDVRRRCAERDRRMSVGERGEFVGVMAFADAMEELWQSYWAEGMWSE